MMQYFYTTKVESLFGLHNLFRKKIRRERCYLTYFQSKMKENNEEQADLKSANSVSNKKLFIETYGCQMNVADSEVVASIMQMDGYELTDRIEEADAIFVNTCSVRDNAEQKIYGRLQYLQSLRKKMHGLVVGVLCCMAERVR